MAADFFTGSKIYWRENKGQWQGVLYYKDENGKSRQKSKLFGPKKRVAQQAFEDWKNELNKTVRVTAAKEVVAPRQSKSVQERMEEYLAYLESLVRTGHLEQSTLTNKRQNAELYIYKEPLAGKPYVKVGKEDIEEWQKGVLGRGISSTTLRTSFSTLRQMYEYDLERGIIEETPFRFLKTPRREKHEVAYATDESLRKLVSYLDMRWKKERGNASVLSYALALYTGMRSEEVCGLMWKDIFIPQKMLKVTQVIARNHGKPYVKPPKNNTSERKIYLTEDVLEMLKDRKRYVCLKEGVDEPKPDWYVVGERERFKNPMQLTSKFIRVCTKNNIVSNVGKPLSPHIPRHTFATIGVQEKTIDIKSLAAILGHSNVSTTLNLYAGAGDDEMRAAGMRGIDEAMKRRAETDD